MLGRSKPLEHELCVNQPDLEDPHVNQPYLEDPNNPPILPILVKCKNEGLAEITIKGIARRLRRLGNKCDLNDPQQVIDFILNLKNKNTRNPIGNSYKNHLLISYERFLNYYKISFQLPPYFKQKQRHPRIPTTEELNTLISSARYPLSLTIQISKETGLRPIEVMTLRTKDIDTSRKTIHPTSAKYGLPRILKISENLTQQLNTYIIKNDLETNQELFKGTSKSYTNQYQISRNRTAKKLGKPILRTIKLYDLRHYFATMLYAKTRYILYVKQQLGHRRLENTLIYTQLIQFEENENYICKVANTQKEMTELIEHGFDFIHEKDGLAYFKKRK